MKPKNRLNDMENKAKRIKKIQFISNTILANACYHVKEMENQITIAEKVGNLSDDEREVITQAWDYRTVIAKELIIELKDFMREHNVKKKI
jgi:hypothetical protein